MDRYLNDMDAAEVREARARRHELIAVLFRRGETWSRVIRGPGQEWVAENCTRKGALESITNGRSSEDFAECCTLAGFNGAAELALVRAQAAGTRARPAVRITWPSPDATSSEVDAFYRAPPTVPDPDTAIVAAGRAYVAARLAHSTAVKAAFKANVRRCDWPVDLHDDIAVLERQEDAARAALEAACQPSATAPEGSAP